jgi:hypothetical protein
MIRNMLINYQYQLIVIRHSIILKIVCFDLPELYAPRPEDYNDFDVRDCVIESWQY